MLALIAIGFGVPLALVVRRLRRLLRLGYGAEDIALALRTGFARKREEFLFEFGPERSKREQFLRVGGAVGLVLAGAIGAAAVAGLRHPELVPLAVVFGYFGMIGTIIGRKWSRLRDGSGPVWSRFWQGAPGRLLARLASFRLGQRAVPANRATELAIAMSAEAVYASFPRELRQSLGDVPEALRLLEAQARHARARIGELDAALLDAGRQPSRVASGDRHEALARDLGTARQAAESRLSDVVTALENLRLDLLRLRAGAGSADGITRDVAAARALGEEADRLIAATREVDETLAR
jgi:hypothetical protein